MSILSHALHNLTHSPGKFIKNLGHTVGDAASKAAPVLPFLTPLGPLGAAAVGAGGSLLGGHNAGQTLTSGALGAAGGTLQQGLSGGGWNPLAVLRQGAGAVGGASGSAGAGIDSAIPFPDPSQITRIQGDGGTDPIPGLGGLGGLYSGGGTDGTGSHGLIGDAAGWLTKGGVGNAAEIGLAGLGAWNASKLGDQANQYAEEAHKNVVDSYNRRKPLRDIGLNGLVNPTAPDTSELTSIRGKIPGGIA